MVKCLRFAGSWPRQDLARDSPAFEDGTSTPLIYLFKGQIILFNDLSGRLEPNWVNMGQNWVFSDQLGSFRDYHSMRARRGGGGILIG